MAELFVEPGEDDSNEQRCLDICLSMGLEFEKLVRSGLETVNRLTMRRAPVHTVNMYRMVKALSNLKELDISYNYVGPQAFRALMLAMCKNVTIECLNISDNSADTDTSELVGRMLSENRTLIELNLSSNHLGNDFLSRCIGPSLASNDAIKVLKLHNVGATNFSHVLEAIENHRSLTHIDFSSNCIKDPVQFATGIKDALENNSLMSLNIRSCNLNSEALSIIKDGLSENASLLEINASANYFESGEVWLDFFCMCISHTSLQVVNVCEARVTQPMSQVPEMRSCDHPSDIHTINISQASVTNQMMSAISHMYKHMLICLMCLDISDNEVTPSCLPDIVQLTSGKKGSCLRQLSWAHNECLNLVQQLPTESFPELEYLNLRRARIHPRAIDHLAALIHRDNFAMIILDGLKISGNDTLQPLLEKGTSSSFSVISLDSCSLADSDIFPLTTALKKNLRISMLKLSNNRLTTHAVNSITEVLLSKDTHPLALIDISQNDIDDDAAKDLSRLYENKTAHRTSIHSINVAHNNIGDAGILALVSCFNDLSPLKSLYVENQRTPISDEVMDNVCQILALSLDFRSFRDTKHPPSAAHIITSLDKIHINLGGSGPDSERLTMIDSLNIRTDFNLKKLPHLTLQNCLLIGAALTGSTSEYQIMSRDDWNMVTGAHKDRELPTWLFIDSHRNRSVYLSHLPTTVTEARLSAKLDAEADCDVEEIILVKDPLTKSVSGIGWVLMKDEKSVIRAIQYYNNGYATIYGKAFSICRIPVTLTQASEADDLIKAREEQKLRCKRRNSDAASYRALLRQSADESWKRHAYRAANPAYADGRVW